MVCARSSDLKLGKPFEQHRCYQAPYLCNFSHVLMLLMIWLSKTFNDVLPKHHFQYSYFSHVLTANDLAI